MIMLQHSKAKVELFKRYWSIYLSILNNVDFISKIYLFDTHAGEGIYENGGKGSPIVAIETIKNIYYQNNRAIKDIEILFNDNEKSDIEIILVHQKEPFFLLIHGVIKRSDYMICKGF